MLNRHHVGRWDDPSNLTLPNLYQGHTEGYRRFELVDHRIAESSVHMGVGLVQIEAGGFLNPLLHAFEKGFYVLEGSLTVSLDGQVFQLQKGDYGLIPMGVTYAWHNTGSAPVRLLEMMAPQPKPDAEFFKDTFFIQGGKAPAGGQALDLGDPRESRYLGHFDMAQLPGPGEIQAVGARGGAIHGISLKELIDRMLGAQHMALFVVRFQPGGEGTVHDHMFEESYIFISGEAEANLDGQKYHITAGEYVWTGVGCMHGFKNIGSDPVLWIETQAPLPTPTEAFRFKAQWEYLREKIEQ